MSHVCFRQPAPSRTKGHKWEECAQVGVYLGHSPQHVHSIALILSLKTGLISPQFHCSFDDLFETALQPGALPMSLWQVKTYFRRETIETQVSMKQSMGSMPPNAAPPESDQQESEDVGQFPESTMIKGNNELQQKQDEEIIQTNNNKVTTNNGMPLCHSTRVRCPLGWRDYIVCECLASEPKHILDGKNLLGFKGSADPDTMYLHEFVQAMDKEIQAHEEGKHWQIVDWKDIPPHMPILPGVWSMKCKHWIDTQEVYKWKARLTIDGNKQKYGIHYCGRCLPQLSPGQLFTSFSFYP